MRKLALLFMLIICAGCAVNLAKEGQANVDLHEDHSYEGTNRVITIKAK